MYLKGADLHIHGEGVESHGANESDSGKERKSTQHEFFSLSRTKHEKDSYDVNV